MKVTLSKQLCILWDTYRDHKIAFASLLVVFALAHDKFAHAIIRKTTVLHCPRLLVRQQQRSQLYFMAIVSFAIAPLSIQITMRTIISAIKNFGILSQ